MEKTETETALDYVSKAVGRVVFIRLRNGSEIRGVLESFDSHMNLVLSESDEIMEEKTRKLGRIIVRGDTVVIVSPAAEVKKYG